MAAGVALLLLLGGTALAADTVASPLAPPRNTAGDDPQLALRQADFETFARARLRQMNDHHVLSRARMQITRSGDGLYRALFHQLDDASMACEVRRSSSRTVQFVAVLSYQERVYAADCASPEECRQGSFVAVKAIPNRHIFVYRDGSWW